MDIAGQNIHRKSKSSRQHQFANVVHELCSEVRDLYSITFEDLKGAGLKIGEARTLLNEISTSTTRPTGKSPVETTETPKVGMLPYFYADPMRRGHYLQREQAVAAHIQHIAAKRSAPDPPSVRLSKMYRTLRQGVPIGSPILDRHVAMAACEVNDSSCTDKTIKSSSRNYDLLNCAAYKVPQRLQQKNALRQNARGLRLLRKVPTRHLLHKSIGVPMINTAMIQTKVTNRTILKAATKTTLLIL
jgi:hypothetical protein